MQGCERRQRTYGLLIADGELVPGDQLLPVRDLARHPGVNVNTVRSPYARLNADSSVFPGRKCRRHTSRTASAGATETASRRLSASTSRTGRATSCSSTATVVGTPAPATSSSTATGESERDRAGVLAEPEGRLRRPLGNDFPRLGIRTLQPASEDGAAFGSSGRLLHGGSVKAICVYAWGRPGGFNTEHGC
jgi:hypothetical protein